MQLFKPNGIQGLRGLTINCRRLLGWLNCSADGSLVKTPIFPENLKLIVSSNWPRLEARQIISAGRVLRRCQEVYTIYAGRCGLVEASARSIELINCSRYCISGNPWLYMPVLFQLYNIYSWVSEIIGCTWPLHFLWTTSRSSPCPASSYHLTLSDWFRRGITPPQESSNC